jgi:hypothetical protein
MRQEQRRNSPIVHFPCSRNALPLFSTVTAGLVCLYHPAAQPVQANKPIPRIIVLGVVEK